MTIEQTIEIPADRRLRLDMPLPFSLPTGRARLALTINIEESPRTVDTHNTIDLPPSYSPDAAIQAAALRRKDSNRKSISQYVGIISSDTFGDGVAYQRQLRDEWND